MRLRSAAWFLAPLLTLAACASGGSEAALEITGDTLVHVATFGLPDGQENANCGYRLTARLTGEPGSTATIRQGRVKYSMAETGVEHTTWEWTPERLASIWEDPEIAAGEALTSKHHDISFSLPFHPIQGEVVFDYTVAGDDAVRTTAPFVFNCR